MKRKILFGSDEIEYEWSPKKVKNFNLRIRPDGSITVSSPFYTKGEDADRFVLAHAKKILISRSRFLSKYVDRHPNPCPENDSFIWVLGEKRQVRLIISPRSNVVLKEQELILSLPDLSDHTARQKLLSSFLEQLCRSEVDRIVKQQYTILFSDQHELEIRYRKMKARWGSCHSAKRILTFNKGLVHVPISCIEYVVCHELIHLIHGDHSSRFYQTLALWMPDWKTRQIELFSFDSLLRF